MKLKAKGCQSTDARPAGPPGPQGHAGPARVQRTRPGKGAPRFGVTPRIQRSTLLAKPLCPRERPKAILGEPGSGRAWAEPPLPGHASGSAGGQQRRSLCSGRGYGLNFKEAWIQTDASCCTKLFYSFLFCRRHMHEHPKFALSLVSTESDPFQKRQPAPVKGRRWPARCTPAHLLHLLPKPPASGLLSPRAPSTGPSTARPACRCKGQRPPAPHLGPATPQCGLYLCTYCRP